MKPGEFLDLVEIATTPNDVLVLTIDGDVVCESHRMEHIRKAAVQWFCRQPRLTPEGRPLKNYKSTGLPSKTMRRLLNGIDRIAAGKPHDSAGVPARAMQTSVRRWSDGLTVRFFEDGRCQWWCRICDGRTPARHLLRMAADQQRMADDWNRHKASGPHVDRTAVTEQVNAIAERLTSNAHDPI